MLPSLMAAIPAAMLGVLLPAAALERGLRTRRRGRRRPVAEFVAALQRQAPAIVQVERPVGPHLVVRHEASAVPVMEVAMEVVVVAGMETRRRGRRGIPGRSRRRDVADNLLVARRRVVHRRRHQREWIGDHLDGRTAQPR